MIELKLSSPPPPDLSKADPDIREVQQRLSVVVSGKYRILKQLGQGGMSTVWLARHRVHGALFALKVLRPALADIPELKEMFYREAVHAGALAGHPNIVPVFDIDCADGLHYLVMPYVRGWDLDALLQRCHHFQWNDALTTTLIIASVLDYAERCGILHGDLSPGNVRIDEFGRVVVLDFGLARSTRLSHSLDTYKLGTPFCMSPEQIRGEDIDIRSDLYAAGALLFQMLTGHPPYRGDTIEAIEEQHLHSPLNIPSEVYQINASIAELLQSLLSKEAKARPQSAKALEQRLLQMGASHRPLQVLPLLEEDHSHLRRRLSNQNPPGQLNAAP